MIINNIIWNIISLIEGNPSSKNNEDSKIILDISI
jgi:hypothetical protein